MIEIGPELAAVIKVIASACVMIAFIYFSFRYKFWE